MKRFLILFLALLLVVGTVACGGKDQTPEQPAPAAETTEAPAKATDAATEEPAPAFAAGEYKLVRYRVGDAVIEGDLLVTSGMSASSLTLNADHTGTLVLMNDTFEIGWTDNGDILISGVLLYTMTRESETAVLFSIGDAVMTFSLDGAAPAPVAVEATEAPAEPETPSETAAPEAGAEDVSSRAPYGDSDGVIDRATLAGLYHWMSDMPSDFCYALTFDEIGAAAGKQGCVNSRDDDTPSAIWTDGGNAIVTVTFKDRKGDGNYTCCAIVKSGLSSDECNAADVSGFPKVASSTPAGTNPTETQTFEVQVGFSGPKVNITASIPTKNWYLQKKYIYCAPNAERADYSSSYFKIECEESLEKIDFYKDSFENLEKLEPRTIGGIEMQGRSYKNVGMDWIEYYGEIAEGVWVSIKLTGVDLSAGTETEAILMSLTFALQ